MTDHNWRPRQMAKGHQAIIAAVPAADSGQPAPDKPGFSPGLGGFVLREFRFLGAPGRARRSWWACLPHPPAAASPLSPREFSRLRASASENDSLLVPSSSGPARRCLGRNGYFLTGPKASPNTVPTAHTHETGLAEGSIQKGDFRDIWLWAGNFEPAISEVSGPVTSAVRRQLVKRAFLHPRWQSRRAAPQDVKH